MPTIEIQIDTPCGEIGVKQDIPLPFPSFQLPLPLPFPPKFRIPLPDCSILKHTDSVADPEEDSSPDLRATVLIWVDITGVVHAFWRRLVDTVWA